MQYIKKSQYPRKASNNLIDARKNDFRPIVPANLEYAVRSVRPIVNTTITSPVTVNTIYDLGVQTSIDIALPLGKIGDFIQFDFVCKDTATTITVSSTSGGIIGYDLIPQTSKVYSLYFDWGVVSCTSAGVVDYGWRCNYSEYSIDITTT